MSSQASEGGKHVYYSIKHEGSTLMRNLSLSLAHGAEIGTNEPPKIKQRLLSSVAIVISSLTVYPTLRALSSLPRTPRIARSA